MRLLLHGFAGHADSWAMVADGRTDTVAITLPGHGEVPIDRPAGFAGGVAFVADAIRTLGEPVHLVGYSLGGRLALATTIEHPELVGRLSVIGAGIGLAETERDGRRTWESQVASILREDGIEAFVAHWEALPLFASQERIPFAIRAAQNEIRRRHDPHHLADAFEAFALSGMPNFWPRLGEIDVPVDLIAGALDTKYAEMARRAADQIRDANIVIVEDCGHNVVLERPDAIARRLET